MMKKEQQDVENDLKELKSNERAMILTNKLLEDMVSISKNMTPKTMGPTQSKWIDNPEEASQIQIAFQPHIKTFFQETTR